MPTVLQIKGYRFYFFSNENNEPMHIHIEKAGANGKVWIEPEIKTAYFYGFKAGQIKDISEIIEEQLETIKTSWNDYFGK